MSSPPDGLGGWPLNSRQPDGRASAPGASRQGCAGAGLCPPLTRPAERRLKASWPLCMQKQRRALDFAYAMDAASLATYGHLPYIRHREPIMTNQDTPDTTRDARLEARVSAAQKGPAPTSGGAFRPHAQRVRRRQRAGRRAPGDCRTRVDPPVARRATGLRASPVEPAATERAPQARRQGLPPTYRHVAGGLEQHHCRASGPAA